MTDIRVAVVGDAAIDHYLWMNPGQLAAEKSSSLRSEWFPGGTGANAAVAVARLDGSVSLFSHVGDDQLGNWVLDGLAAEGVGTEHVVRLNGHTTTALVLFQGDRRSVVVAPGVANAPFPRESIAEMLTFDLVYCSYAPHTAIALAHAGAGGRVVLGLEPWMLDDELRLALPQFMVVVVNQDGFEALGDVPPDVALVETRGSDGIRLHGLTGRIDFAAIPTDAVDTTGAGDAFAGALCRYLSDGDELRGAAAKAVQVAAMATRGFGSQTCLPRSADLRS